MFEFSNEADKLKMFKLSERDLEKVCGGWFLSSTSFGVERDTRFEFSATREKYAREKDLLTKNECILKSPRNNCEVSFQDYLKSCFTDCKVYSNAPSKLIYLSRKELTDLLGEPEWHLPLAAMAFDIQVWNLNNQKALLK